MSGYKINTVKSVLIGLILQEPDRAKISIIAGSTEPGAVPGVPGGLRHSTWVWGGSWNAPPQCSGPGVAPKVLFCSALDRDSFWSVPLQCLSPGQLLECSAVASRHPEPILMSASTVARRPKKTMDV